MSFESQSRRQASKGRGGALTVEPCESILGSPPLYSLPPQQQQLAIVQSWSDVGGAAVRSRQFAPPQHGGQHGGHPYVEEPYSGEPHSGDSGWRVRA